MRYHKNFKKFLPQPNKAPSSYYETKKLTKAFRLPIYKIHVFEDNCMLFWKVEDRYLLNCQFCGKDGYHPNKGKGKIDLKTSLSTLKEKNVTIDTLKLSSSTLTRKNSHSQFSVSSISHAFSRSKLRPLSLMNLRLYSTMYVFGSFSFSFSISCFISFFCKLASVF